MATIDVKLAPPDEDIPATIHQMLGVINDLVTAVKELIDDHATTKTLQDELIADHATFLTEQTAIGTTLADYKTIYDAHTHRLPATPAEDENTSAPDTTGATGSKAPGAASAFTDTSGSPPATLTAAAIATLTAADPDDFTFKITGETASETVTPS